MRDIRRTAEWRRVRRFVLANSTVCHLCGQPLNFAAPARSRWSPSVDHVVPLNRMRDLDPLEQRRLALDPANLRAAHYGCNSGRGDRARRDPPRTSRPW